MYLNCILLATHARPSPHIYTQIPGKNRFQNKHSIISLNGKIITDQSYTVLNFCIYLRFVKKYLAKIKTTLAGFDYFKLILSLSWFLLLFSTTQYLTFFFLTLKMDRECLILYLARFHILY